MSKYQRRIGTSAKQFKFDLTVQDLQFDGPMKGKYQVLQSRGAKVAATTFVSGRNDDQGNRGVCVQDETLSLISTLYEHSSNTNAFISKTNGSKPYKNKFQSKPCRIIIKNQKVGKSNRTIGKIDINLADLIETSNNKGCKESHSCEPSYKTESQAKANRNTVTRAMSYSSNSNSNTNILPNKTTLKVKEKKHFNSPSLSRCSSLSRQSPSNSLQTLSSSNIKCGEASLKVDDLLTQSLTNSCELCLPLKKCSVDKNACLNVVFYWKWIEELDNESALTIDSSSIDLGYEQELSENARLNIHTPKRKLESSLDCRSVLSDDDRLTETRTNFNGSRVQKKENTSVQYQIASNSNKKCESKSDNSNSIKELANRNRKYRTRRRSLICTSPSSSSFLLSQRNFSFDGRRFMLDCASADDNKNIGGAIAYTIGRTTTSCKNINLTPGKNRPIPPAKYEEHIRMLNRRIRKTVEDFQKSALYFSELEVGYVAAKVELCNAVDKIHDQEVEIMNLKQEINRLKVICSKNNSNNSENSESKKVLIIGKETESGSMSASVSTNKSKISETDVDNNEISNTKQQRNRRSTFRRSFQK